MALVLKDRVVETTDVAGTGSASLLGAQDGYQAFSVIGNGNTTYYTIYDPVAFDWEVGIGTYASSGNVLARTTVLSSSNSGSLVSFGAGTKDIFLDLPSEKVVALGALSYQGTWNATTNVPTLASGVGTQGYYYVVATAGSTNLDGITDWKIGDWAIYSGTAWQKIDNTDAVSSVNGQTGTVVLTYSDVGAQVAGTYVTSVSGTAPVASSGGTTPAISMAKATGSVDGYLSSTDWTTFNNKGTVTSVTGTAPVVSSGGATPAISMAAATSSVNGYLTSTDWTTFNDKQSAFGSQTANYVYAAPNGSAGTPTFRALVSADIPSLSYIPYTGATSAVDLNTQTVVNIDHLGIGTTSVPTILVRAVGDNNSNSRIAVRGYSSNANSSSMRVTKFRGTAGAPQAPQSGDSLGKFELAGYGTTSSDGYPQASFEGLATENWGAAARGAKALIKVTPNTTITQVTAVTIDQDSKATFAGAMAVTGHTTFEGVTSTGATGTGKLVYDTSPTLVTPALGIPASGTLTNCTGLPNAGLVNSAITINGTSTALGSSISVGTVTSVTGTAPVVSSGGATPEISMAAATTSVSGYLTSTDWTTFNNKTSNTGTVTSVGQTFTGGLISVAGSPVTTSGTLALTVAGTSGGIPYFSSATGWASSAALTASALIIGGGAGVAPSSITTGTGVITALGVNTGAAGSFVVYNNGLGTPTSGNLSSCTADGTDQVGFKNIPQNSQSAAYTLVLADAGKHIYHPASDANVRTFTIPAASSVAYPIGTAITFVNLSASVVTIAITTDTMYLSSAGTTGSRSLAQYGTATALKVSGLSSAGIWVISGSGLT